MTYKAIKIGDDTWLDNQIGELVLAPGFDVGKIYDETGIELVDQYRHGHCDWTDGKPGYEIPNVSYLYRRIARLKPPITRRIISESTIEKLITKYEIERDSHYQGSESRAIFEFVLKDLKQLLK